MFHLRTFGGLALDRDGTLLDGAQRKSLALLAVLAARPSKGVGRDRLMALLWPESDTEHARGRAEADDTRSAATAGFA